MKNAIVVRIDGGTLKMHFLLSTFAYSEFLDTNHDPDLNNNICDISRYCNQESGE